MAKCLGIIGHICQNCKAKEHHKIKRSVRNKSDRVFCSNFFQIENIAS